MVTDDEVISASIDQTLVVWRLTIIADSIQVSLAIVPASAAVVMGKAKSNKMCQVVCLKRRALQDKSARFSSIVLRHGRPRSRAMLKRTPWQPQPTKNSVT